jgi:hypothetical protein
LFQVLYSHSSAARPSSSETPNHARGLAWA